jgi:hypothetical protein
MASATLAWKYRLTASAIRLAVVKSGVCRFSTTLLPSSKGLATVRSTLAPFGMRPALGMLTVILDPSAP